MPTSARFYIAFIALILGVLFMGYQVDRSNGFEVVGGFTWMFVAMLVMLKNTMGVTIRNLLLLGIAVRAVLLFSTPKLSDDYHRFFWDGSLTLHQVNPYGVLPNDARESIHDGADDLQLALREMNSAQYYTVYPPINQAYFAAGVLFGRHTMSGFLFWMHLFLILAESLLMLLMVLLLVKSDRNPQLVAFYAFNPLVIIEFSGNLHFEGVVLFFLAITAWMLMHHRVYLASVPLALAVSVKLLPLIFLPSVWTWLKGKRWLFYLLVGLLFVLTFAPFVTNELLDHWHSSLSLYFRTFEFNASIYYVVNRIWGFVVGYNPIAVAGPLMSVLTLAAILIVAFKRSLTIPERIYWSLMIYLLGATTVHPWYVAPLVAWMLFTSRRDALLWSFLVTLSYLHYHQGNFTEHYAWIAIEYTILFIAIFTHHRWSQRIPLMM